jgi:hypothetical protein
VPASSTSKSSAAPLRRPSAKRGTAALDERLAAFDTQITERQQEYLAHVSGLAERGDALAERLAALGTEMERIATQGRKRRTALPNPPPG